MSRNVLFVDDEPNILMGLKNRLRRQRSKWDMRFVQSGREALEILAHEPIDVVVTDMRMPEMDGATLLKRVQEEYPHVVRIVLSGHAEMETALRAIPVAHQFLNKPSDPGEIENMVERACNLQLLMNHEVVRRTVGKLDKLPSLPKIHAQLMATLARPSATTNDVARVLKQDMAMCAKTLQMVNSAFFRRSRIITKIEEAVSYLGFTAIKQIVLAVEVFQHSGGKLCAGVSLEELQKHALWVGVLCSSMTEDKQRKEDAFAAGLLHDIGKLVLAAELPKHMDQVLAEMKQTGCTMHAAEERVWGVTHAEIGAYLLGVWGLPYSIVEAVANHHVPGRVESTELGLVGVTHVADVLAWEQQHPDDTRTPESLDTAYLERLGVSGRLDDWRALARSQTSALTEA